MLWRITMSLPEHFYIGAATAAHQVEGNNTNSDDWALEQMPHGGFVEPSGIACDHYNRYAEDIKMMADAGLNAYRFSIEWARIEPEQGVFDEKEIAHYRDVIACCKKNGIEPIVTLMHFTSPVWVIRECGWDDARIVDLFRDYVRKVISELGSELKYVVTINEANMRLQVKAIADRFRKNMMAKAARMQAAAANSETGDKAAAGEGKAAKAGQAREGQVQVGLDLKSLMAGQKAAAEEKAAVFGTPDPRTFVSPCEDGGDLLVMKCHEAAREVIHELYPDIKVGLSLSLHDIQSVPGGEENAAKEWEEEFVHYLPYIKDDDFLGVQNYTRAIYGAEGALPNPEGAELTQMDYEFYPQGLEHVIRRVAEDFKGEIFVTENGIATADDTRRVAYIQTALAGVENAMKDGIPVIGYTYWSLMDNFEWQKGYSMTFGLIAVDRTTQERKPKESLKYLGSFAQ